MRRVHLVGDFPETAVDDLISTAGGQLGSLIRSMPLDAGGSAADAAAQRFIAMQDSAVIPVDMRAQFSLELMPDASIVGPDVRSLATLLPDNLSIQVIVPIWSIVERENGTVRQAALRDTMKDSMLQAIAGIPLSASVSLHFCGRDGASHKMSSFDLEMMVDFANHVVANARRDVDVFHMSTPLRHESGEFFHALADLDPVALPALHLGIIHLTDGVDGARHRAEFAMRNGAGPSFGIAGRCGFGAREAGELPPYMRLHREVALALD